MRALLVALVFVLSAARARADEFVVIVNAKNTATKIDKKVAADFFLKKRTRWGDDRQVKPVDLQRSSKTRQKFSSTVLDRTVEAVRTYWNQLVFSGRGIPPPELETDKAVVDYVAANLGAIGYVSASADLASVKVVKLE